MKKIIIEKLAFLEIKDKKLLVSLSTGNTTWYIPGGKREEGETDLQALTREVKEELNVDIDPNSLKFFGIFEAPAHEKPKDVMVKMLCYFAKYKGTPTPSSEIEKLDYFSYNQKHLTSQVDNLIFEDLKKKKLIE